MAKRKYSSEFKAKVALAAIKGDETTSQIASRFGIHPGQVRAWKREFLKNATLVFEKNSRCVGSAKMRLLGFGTARHFGHMRPPLVACQNLSGQAKPFGWLLQPCLPGPGRLNLKVARAMGRQLAPCLWRGSGSRAIDFKLPFSMPSFFFVWPLLACVSFP